MRVQDNRLQIGAATTYAEIVRSRVAEQHVPCLVAAAREEALKAAEKAAKKKKGGEA